MELVKLQQPAQVIPVRVTDERVLDLLRPLHERRGKAVSGIEKDVEFLDENPCRK